MQEEKALKILMLEDNENDVVLIERVLRKDNLSFVCECVDTRAEFDAAIRNFKPDVVLSDHGLPQFNSHEALKICIRERAFIPFILVTGTMSDEFAISILRDGADDYILKSNLSRLPSAIRRAVKERKLERLKREARHALRKQNKELLKVNHELDNFVYSVSHNLRGPLASVMGLLNIAKGVDTQGQMKAVHGMMSASINRLNQTLYDILEYSKNSRNEIQLSEINWSESIQSSFDKLEYMEQYARIRKVIKLDILQPFYSDRARIENMLTNLFSNSISYLDKNKDSFIEVNVSCMDNIATITIHDNGIGIHPTVMPKVFDMFYRGTEESLGAGLGLYIVKETIAKLSAEIHLESQYGESTSVTLTLPNLHECELA